jgi:ABC-type uncharacterized transport system ATPase subunit
MGITVEAVSKQFGDFKAVGDINMEVKNGSLVTLLYLKGLTYKSAWDSTPTSKRQSERGCAMQSRT